MAVVPKCPGARVSVRVSVRVRARVRVRVGVRVGAGATVRVRATGKVRVRGRAAHLSNDDHVDALVDDLGAERRGVRQRGVDRRGAHVHRQVEGLADAEHGVLLRVLPLGQVLLRHGTADRAVQDGLAVDAGLPRRLGKVLAARVERGAAHRRMIELERLAKEPARVLEHLYRHVHDLRPDAVARQHRHRHRRRAHGASARQPQQSKLLSAQHAESRARACLLVDLAKGTEGRPGGCQQRTCFHQPCNSSAGSASPGQTSTYREREVDHHGGRAASPASPWPPPSPPRDRPNPNPNRRGRRAMAAAAEAGAPMAAAAGCSELHPLLLKQAHAAGASREHLDLTPPVVALLEQVSRT